MSHFLMMFYLKQDVNLHVPSYTEAIHCMITSTGPPAGKETKFIKSPKQRVCMSLRTASENDLKWRHAVRIRTFTEERELLRVSIFTSASPKGRCLISNRQLGNPEIQPACARVRFGVSNPLPHSCLPRPRCDLHNNQSHSSEPIPWTNV